MQHGALAGRLCSPQPGGRPVGASSPDRAKIRGELAAIWQVGQLPTCNLYLVIDSFAQASYIVEGVSADPCIVLLPEG